MTQVASDDPPLNKESWLVRWWPWLIFFGILIVSFRWFSFWHEKDQKLQWIEHWLSFVAELFVGFVILAEVKHALETSREETKARHEEELRRFSQDFLKEAFSPPHDHRPRLYSAFADFADNPDLKARRTAFVEHIGQRPDLQEIADSQMTHVAKLMFLADTSEKRAIVIRWNPHTIVRLWVMCGVYWKRRYTNRWSWGVPVLIAVRESLKQVIPEDRTKNPLQIAGEKRTVTLETLDLEDLTKELAELEAETAIERPLNANFRWRERETWNLFHP
jgi:hypothetical protein